MTEVVPGCPSVKGELCILIIILLAVTHRPTELAWHIEVSSE